MLNNPLKRTVSNKSFHRRSTRHRRKTRYSSQSDHGAEDVKPTIVHQLSRQLSKKFTNISLTSDQIAMSNEFYDDDELNDDEMTYC